jgi:hypothetical protein
MILSPLKRRSEMKKVTLEVQCTYCKDVIKLEVTETQLQRLNKGDEKVQKILPDKTAGERELLISKVCEPCYDTFFLR